MASNDLAKITELFKQNREGGGNGGRRYYPFWLMDLDESAVVRLLPDKNAENPKLFFVEKKVHKLEINGQSETIPCLEMYGEECPICKVSRQYYKQEGKGSVNGKKYFRKLTQLCQVLVMKDPIKYKDGEQSAEGEVRIVDLTWQIFNVIKEAFKDGDLEEVPWSYTEGTDFIIKKTPQGDYGSYTSSKFAKRTSALTEEQIEFCKESLADLVTLLPEKPERSKVDRMLRAAMTGGAYQEDESEIDYSNVGKNRKKANPVADSIGSDDEAFDDTPAPVIKKSEPAKVSDLGDDEDDPETQALLESFRKRNSRRSSTEV